MHVATKAQKTHSIALYNYEVQLQEEAISEVSKGDCIIMGDFNRGRGPKVFVTGTGQFLNST